MNRLKEPSTWAGLSAMSATVSHLLPGTAGLVVGGLSAVFGSLAVFLREQGGNA